MGSDAPSAGNFAFVPQTSFCGETSGDLAKCRLFCQADTPVHFVNIANNSSLRAMELNVNEEIICKQQNHSPASSPTNILSNTEKLTFKVC